MSYTSKQKIEFNKQRKLKGLCIECNSKAVKGSIRCERCNERRKQYNFRDYHKWKNEGKCTQCGKKILTGKLLCEKHYLMHVSSDRLNSGKFWQELKLLLEKQNYKCALTGDKISFETNIELDHITPISRSGKKELSNVRWTTKESNRLKQDLTDKELKELCEKILKTI
jgi:5-methylcytosine-specific restriction endonuclease McrA